MVYPYITALLDENEEEETDIDKVKEELRCARKRISQLENENEELKEKIMRLDSEQ